MLNQQMTTTNDFLKTVNVGGVPEHFNLAWHLAIERGDFLNQGIEINWQDVPGGTGAMCAKLRNGELDIAIALTEGIIADIMDGNPSKIVQFYVNSPLKWGVYTGKNSGIKDLNNIENLRYAISRFKSGSHLMAYINADRLNTTVNENNFVVVGNLNGARKALANNDADLFMWEKFTTKPYVDNGEFKMLGECSTPWPCFVVVVRNEFLMQNEQLLKTILNIVNQSCLTLKYNDVEAVDLIAWRYQLKLADALQLFSELEYAYSPQIDEIQFTSILNDLKKLNIIQRIPALEEICYMPNLTLIE
jgi:ABC-type nitrate/sulfonate/bicarbonate transport system substrate-binding protein